MNIKQQIEKEIAVIEDKGISINNIDLLYKLASINYYIDKNTNNNHDNIHNDIVIDNYKNNQYDKDISQLYYDFVQARKIYIDGPDTDHRSIMLLKLNILFAEIEDLVNNIWDSATSNSERELIDKMIQHIANH